jgi:hypothetical protein
MDGGAGIDWPACLDDNRRAASLALKVNTSDEKSDMNYSLMQTDLVSVYRSMALWPISRPQPDCL